MGVLSNISSLMKLPNGLWKKIVLIGFGDHLLKRIVPWMKLRGIDSEIIEKMMIDNPTNMLTIK